MLTTTEDPPNQIKHAEDQTIRSVLVALLACNDHEITQAIRARAAFDKPGASNNAVAVAAFFHIVNSALPRLTTAQAKRLVADGHLVRFAAATGVAGRALLTRVAGDPRLGSATPRIGTLRRALSK
ncbi:MAG TPA: hypothetical protein VGO62_17500 [Myxococcota bacterium]